MALATALRVWFLGVVLGSGIGTICLVGIVLTLKLLGRNFVAPLWTYPLVVLTAAAVCAIPAAYRVYERKQR